MSLKKQNHSYKWVILILCFFMEFVCLGFCSSNGGLYTKAVTEALGIKRSLYSLGSSIRYVVQVLVALNFGALVNKFGTKKMVFVGLVSLTGSVAVRAVATNIFHFYIGFALWGLGIVFSGGTMASTIVRRWFHKDVGRYTGLVMSANGIGGAIAAQIISPMINNGEVFGYRNAYLLSAAVSLAVSIIVLVFLRENPADGPAVQTDGKKKPKGVLWVGIPYETVKKKPYFYLIALLVFLTGISLQSVGGVGLVHMADLGMDAGFIATTATVFSLCLTFSKVLVGVTYDKKGLRFTLLMCLSATLGCFLMCALMANTPLGKSMAMAARVLEALAIPIETVMIPLLVSDLFGSASYNKVLGVFYAMNSLGLCLGSPLGELFYDFLGTYKPCFWIFSVLIVSVIIGYIFVLKAAYKEKNKVLAAIETTNA